MWELPGLRNWCDDLNWDGGRGACGQGFHGRFSRRGFPGTDGEHGAEARRRGGRMGGRKPL